MSRFLRDYAGPSALNGGGLCVPGAAFGPGYIISSASRIKALNPPGANLCRRVSFKKWAYRSLRSLLVADFANQAR